jgi:hypothetical protein
MPGLIDGYINPQAILAYDIIASDINIPVCSAEDFL